MIVENTRSGCLSTIMVFLLSGVAVSLTAMFVPGVHVESFWPDAVVAAVVISIVNALVRPLLVLLTLPVTVMTLGLFLLVVNAATFALSAWFLDGLRVDGFAPALVGALVLSAVSSVLGKVFGRSHDDER